jgi:hypothetical protein
MHGASCLSSMIGYLHLKTRAPLVRRCVVPSWGSFGSTALGTTALLVPLKTRRFALLWCASEIVKMLAGEACEAVLAIDVRTFTRCPSSPFGTFSHKKSGRRRISCGSAVSCSTPCLCFGTVFPNLPSTGRPVSNHDQVRTRPEDRRQEHASLSPRCGAHRQPGAGGHC